MTLSIVAIDGTTPKQTKLTLTCDGDGHGLFPATQEFADRNGFIGQYGAAMNAGWKDTKGPNGRLFLGPCCSGKASQ
jgi:hypothetical protein